MQHFIVTFKVDGPTLPALLSAIAPECQLVSVTPEAKEPPHHKKITRRFAHRRGNGADGKSVQDIILEELTKADINGRTLAQLGKSLKTNGLAEKSASPRLSQLLSQGRVKRNDDGFWVKVR